MHLACFWMIFTYKIYIKNVGKKKCKLLSYLLARLSLNEGSFRHNPATCTSCYKDKGRKLWWGSGMWEQAEKMETLVTVRNRGSTIMQNVFGELFYIVTKMMWLIDSFIQSANIDWALFEPCIVLGNRIKIQIGPSLDL